MSLLSIRDLHVSLSGKPVLKGISLDVGSHEFVGLIGPNGAGKSTLLRAALGLVHAKGSVQIAGTERQSLSPREQALAVSYLPQEREIAWALTVERLVWLGRAPYRAAFTPVYRADREAVERAMQAMAIDPLRTRSASALSGGEKARVLVARALAQEAPLLLADEPTAGLDPSHQIALMQTFAGLAQEGRGVVICLHDLGLAARWCTRLVLIADGAVVADGEPRAVLTQERLRDIYHIETFLAEHAGGPIIHPYDLAHQNTDIS